jgi:hypothetical protein
VLFFPRCIARRCCCSLVSIIVSYRGGLGLDRGQLGLEAEELVIVGGHFGGKKSELELARSLTHFSQKKLLLAFRGFASLHFCRDRHTFSLTLTQANALPLASRKSRALLGTRASGEKSARASERKKTFIDKRR